MGMFYGSISHTTSGRRKKTTRKRTGKSFSAVYKGNSSISGTNNTYRRDTPDYPSAPDTAGVAARKDSPKYTGTLVKGIGTMHKSNAVPIINEQEMIDIARMRR